MRLQEMTAKAEFVFPAITVNYVVMKSNLGYPFVGFHLSPDGI